MIELLNTLQANIANKITEIAIKAVLEMQRSPRFITWTWDTIKSFGEAKALKTSYVFLFVVPVAARAFQAIPNSIEVPLSHVKVVLNLGLPFSWVILFTCACLASLGNIMYAAFCPKLVREFPDYPAFLNSGRGPGYLAESLKMLALRAEGETIREVVEDVTLLYIEDEYTVDERFEDGFCLVPVPANNFYFTRDACNLAKPIVRLIASTAYFGAFICLGIIAIQNIVFVVDYLISN